uniref:Uncharacterized protein n=1 Tax=Lepeophtheirus salmonis TaxID=72036 RepID=A0A0K2U3E5_LEPSM
MGKNKDFMTRWRNRKHFFGFIFSISNFFLTKVQQSIKSWDFILRNIRMPIVQEEYITNALIIFPPYPYHRAGIGKISDLECQLQHF